MADVSQPVIHPSEIPDSRPLTTTFIPSTDENTAHTLVIQAFAAPPSPVAVPLVHVAPPPVALERLRFRDEDALPAWWRLAPPIPLDPAPAKPEHIDPQACTVALRSTTPDTATARGATIVKNVHPEMAGDFIRAGWRRVA